VSLQDSDVVLLKRFVEGGGRLILAANYFFRGTVSKSNELLEPYGLRMQDTESPATRDIEIQGAQIRPDPLTEGVNALHFFRPSQVAVTDPNKARILVSVPDHPGEGIVAVARAGEGEVVALGQSLWWNWIATEKGKASDNAALLANLLKKSQKRK
jgi:hypothetical protein